MALRQSLQDFMDGLAGAGSNAPDEYPEWSSWTYETHMADIKALWFEIRPQLQRDVARADEIDVRLREMFAAFDAGEREEGRKVAWAIHNSGLTKLR